MVTPPLKQSTLVSELAVRPLGCGFNGKGEEGKGEEGKEGEEDLLLLDCGEEP